MTSDPFIITFSAWLILPLLWLVYVLPMIIANSRHHQDLTAIWALNLFGGWTIVGWVIALVWSLTDYVREADIGQLKPAVRRSPTKRFNYG
jgi:T4 superinfection immunity protein